MEQKQNQEAVAEMGVGDLYAVGISLVVLGIGIAYGQNILSDTKDDMADCASTHQFNAASDLCVNVSDVTTGQGDYTPNNIEWNSTTDTQAAVGKIPKKLGLLVTVIIAAVILGVLTRYLVVRQQAE